MERNPILRLQVLNIQSPGEGKRPRGLGRREDNDREKRSIRVQSGINIAAKVAPHVGGQNQSNRELYRPLPRAGGVVLNEQSKNRDQGRMASHHRRIGPHAGPPFRKFCASFSTRTRLAGNANQRGPPSGEPHFSCISRSCAVLPPNFRGSLARQSCHGPWVRAPGGGPAHRFEAPASRKQSGHAREDGMPIRDFAWLFPFGTAFLGR